MAHDGKYTQAHFGDFGDYADYLQDQSAQIEVQKLDDSEFSADLKLYTTQDFQISLASTSAPLIRRGAHADGVWAFGLARRRPMPMHWCGYEAHSQVEIAMFPQQEYVNITRSNLDAYGLTFSSQYFEQVAEAEEIDLNSRLKKACYGRVIRLDEAHANRLEWMAQSVLAKSEISDGTAIAHRLATELIQYLNDSEKTRARPTSSARRKAYDRARRYMQAYAREELSIRDVCRNTSMSARTLSYAFKEHAGVSPMRYLKVYRLNKLRQALRKAAPGDAQVSEFANEWGFWHLGKLAADYRSLFGVTPAQDLRVGPV